MTKDIFSLLFNDENEYDSFRSVHRMVENARKISEDLTKVRRERFRSVSEFSIYSNIKEEVIREFEQGGGSISLPALRRYASSLGIELEIKLIGEVQETKIGEVQETKTGVDENYIISQNLLSPILDFGEIYHFLGRASVGENSNISNFHKQSRYV